MTDKSFVDVEMMVMLPLGVLATKLQRIEAELRLLSMLASSIPTGSQNSSTTQRIDDQLELIDTALDSIKGLLSNFKADMNHLTPDAPASMTYGSTEDEYSSRKPYPELDD